MSESAEALAANLKSRRNITIEISNLSNSYWLIDPKVYLENGHIHSPPQPTVASMKTEVCNFTKGGGKTSGAVGVLTYDLCHREHGVREKMAIMFSVPFDYNLFKNWAGLGIFQKDRETNEEMYKVMYNEKEPTDFVREEAKGCCVTYVGRDLDIKGVMSPMGRCMMKVEVWDKLFTPPGEQRPSGPY